MFERLKELLYAAELTDDERQVAKRTEAQIQSEIRRVMNGLNPDVTPTEDQIPQLVECANSFLQSKGFSELPKDFEFDRRRIILNHYGDSFHVIVPWIQLDKKHFLEQRFCSRINDLGVCVTGFDDFVYHEEHNPYSFVISDGHDW